MNKGLMIAVLTLAVVSVGLFLVMDGGLLGGVDDPVTRDSARGGAVDADSPDVDGPGRADDVTGGRRNPVLFGRGSARIGECDVIGRVADFITKEHVVGAAVRLEGVGYGHEVVAVSTETGEDGRFHLAAVPAGEGYALEVVVDEAVARRVAGVTVSAGGVEDLGTIWLGDAGALTGRVVSIEGGAIAGASVRVFPGGTPMEQMMTDIVGFISKLDRDPEPLAQGTTDANGRFRIEGVPPGPITIVVRASGFYQQIRQAAMTKDGVPGDEPLFRMEPAVPVTGRVVSDLGGGIAGARIAVMDQRAEEDGFYGRRFVETETDGSFRVESPPQASRLVAIVAAEDYPTLFSEVGDKREGLEFTLVGGATLTLRFVHDDTGEPIPDASIVAMLSEGDEMDREGTFLSGVSDAQGEIELEARPGFVNMLFFAHREFGPSLYSPQWGVGLGGAALKGPAKLQVVAGENRAELRKPSGVLISGTVTNAGGEPVPGATVRVFGGFEMMGSGKVLTDESGVYRLMAAQVPQMAIVVESPGYVQDPATRGIQLGDASQVEHDVQLLTAARVEGLVVGPKGEPARGLHVRLQLETDVSERDGSGFVGDANKPGITDSAGRYVLEDVVPDRTYHVVGKGEGYVVTRSDAFEVRSSVGVVKAPRVTMQAGLRVEVVVRAPSGDTVTGANVDVHVEPAEKVEWDDMSRWRAFQKLVTDAHGHATAKDVPSGKVTFTASAKGYASARGSRTVSRESPPSSPFEVRLRQATVVAGEVRDQHGDAVKGVRVNVNGVGEEIPGQATIPGQAGSDEDWMPSSSDTTDARGRFEIEGVPAGAKISIWVHAEGYTSRSFPIDGPTDRLQLQIQKVDPEKQRRLQELQAEFIAVYQRLEAAKDDTERQALQRQIGEIHLEMNRLREDGTTGSMRVERTPATVEDGD